MRNWRRPVRGNDNVRKGDTKTKGVIMGTNGNEGGGVAVEAPCRAEDLAAIEAGLKQMTDEEVRAIVDLIEPADSDDDRTRLMDFFAACMTDETVASIRQTLAMYNSDNYDAYVAKHDEEVQDLVRECLPFVDKAILLNKIGRMLRDRSVPFLAGVENFLSLATDGAAG